MFIPTTTQDVHSGRSNSPTTPYVSMQSYSVKSQAGFVQRRKDELSSPSPSHIQSSISSGNRPAFPVRSASMICTTDAFESEEFHNQFKRPSPPALPHPIPKVRPRRKTESAQSTDQMDRAQSTSELPPLPIPRARTKIGSTKSPVCQVQSEIPSHSRSSPGPVGSMFSSAYLKNFLGHTSLQSGDGGNVIPRDRTNSVLYSTEDILPPSSGHSQSDGELLQEISLSEHDTDTDTGDSNINCPLHLLTSATPCMSSKVSTETLPHLSSSFSSSSSIMASPDTGIRRQSDSSLHGHTVNHDCANPGEAVVQQNVCYNSSPKGSNSSLLTLSSSAPTGVANRKFDIVKPASEGQLKSLLKSTATPNVTKRNCKYLHMPLPQPPPEFHIGSSNNIHPTLPPKSGSDVIYDSLTDGNDRQDITDPSKVHSAELEVKLKSLLSDEEFSKFSVEICRDALVQEGYILEKAKDNIRVQLLLNLRIPNVSAKKCWRALAHCQHKLDRAASWLVEMNST